MVHVVIPVYNHAKALGRCLSSLYGQTLRPGLIVVVDDGSQDDPESVVRKWQDKFNCHPEFSSGSILVFVRQENRGAPAARNRGFNAMCQTMPGDAVGHRRFAGSSGRRPPTLSARLPSLRSGPSQPRLRELPNSITGHDFDEYVIFCDADIVMNPDCLEKMQKALEEHPEASYAYSSFKFGLKKFECGAFSAERLRKMPFITSTSLIRLKDYPGFLAFGQPAVGWDESLKKFQDWDLWLTMLEQGKTGIWIPEVLFSAKPRKAGMSSWLPSFIHKIPWPIFGWMPSEVRKYREAKRIILEKHKITM